MNFNKHSDLEGKHAFLGASKYHWIRYDKDKIAESFRNHLAVERGTRLHAFASECIKLRIKLPRSKNTLNLFVNDAIGYKMESEQPLYFSENCFGTADAISFRNKTLRIHDLKTGASKTHMEQLEIYAALFCLEYKIRPVDIQIELRIYQNDEVLVHNPDPIDILAIMEKITEFDKIIRTLRIEEE